MLWVLWVSRCLFVFVSMKYNAIEMGERVMKPMNIYFFYNEHNLNYCDRIDSVRIAYTSKYIEVLLNIY